MTRLTGTLLSTLLVGCGSKAVTSSARTGDKDGANSGNAEVQTSSGTIDSEIATPQAATGSSLTYTGLIKPILDKQCVPCHGTTPASGAPSNFQLSSFGLEHGVPGISSALDDIKTAIENGSMPPDGFKFQPTDAEKIMQWIAAGMPETETSGPAVPGSEATDGSLLKLTTPANLGEVVAGTYMISGDFQNVGPNATWSAYFTTVAGATSGGKLIAGSVPVKMGIPWSNAIAQPAGTYYIYAVVRDGGKDLTPVNAPGSLVVGSGGGLPPDIVTFRIAAGTGKNPYNTKATMVTALIGQIVRIFNDDSVPHRLHTGGAPCAHQPANTPPGGFFDCVVIKIIDPSAMARPPTYDHINGTGSEFWIKAVP